MWCRRRGRVCIMVTEKYTGKIRFIRRKAWFNMTDDEIEKYIW